MNKFHDSKTVNEVADFFGVTKQTLYYRKNRENSEYMKELYTTKEELRAFLIQLYDLYCVKRLTQVEVAKRFNVTQITISRQIRKHRIKYRLDLARTWA